MNPSSCKNIPTYNVVHALRPDPLVHLLVAVQLIRHCPEKTGSVLPHLLDHVSLHPHVPLKPHVLLPPLLLSEGLAHVAVLILAVVPLLLTFPELPGHGRAGHPGAAAGVELVTRGVSVVGVAGPLGAGRPVPGVVIVRQLVMRGEPFLRA